LKNNGVKIVTNDIEYSVPASVGSGADKASIQKLNQMNCDIELTVFRSGDEIAVDAAWTHEVNYDWWNNESGKKPDDIVGISFAEDDYVLESWSSGSYTERKEHNPSAIAFEYCDACCEQYEEAAGSCTPQGETFEIDDWAWVVLSEKTTGTKDHIYFDYHHLFSEAVVESVTYSSDGVSVTLSEEENSWHIDDRIHEDDA